MTIELDVQVASASDSVPGKACFQRWVEAALQEHAEAHLAIRVVDRKEGAELNLRYRSLPGPTNVLSFTAELPAEIDLPLLGDIVICAPLVAEEALEQEKDPEAHWAHLVIHGVLHLLGFDHQTRQEAHRMEAQETALLASLGYPDPYE
jgi:probable rRNA maturation factor